MNNIKHEPRNAGVFMRPGYVRQQRINKAIYYFGLIIALGVLGYFALVEVVK